MDISSKNFLLNVLCQRTRALILALFNSQVAKSVMAAMSSFISAVKAVNFTQPAIFQFDENEIKRKILPHYGESYREGNEIMSNVDGRMTEIAFTLGNGSNFFNPIVAVMQAKKAEPGFRVNIMFSSDLTRHGFEAFMKKEGFNYPPPIVVFTNVVASGNTTFWVRDSAIRLKNGAIVEPRYFARYSDSQEKDFLAPTEGTDLRQSPLVFEGGNLRATAQHLFIGYNDVASTAAVLKKVSFQAGSPPFNLLTPEDYDKAVKAFEKEFGKKVIVVGMERSGSGRWLPPRNKQRCFHIDMMITPLNDRDVLVGESKEGSEARDYYNSIAEQLRREGFNVLRLPIIDFNRGDNVITYNNAVVEVYQGVKKVYLPQYYYGAYPATSSIYPRLGIDLELVNKEARKKYEEIGFEVVPIPMSMDHILQQGALNCITFERR